MAAFEHCLENALVSDGVISQSDAQAAQLWRLREGITESLARYVPYKNDVAVRISAMPVFLAEAQALLQREYPAFEVVWFGHIGDGNLHINVLKPDDTGDAEFVQQCEHVTKLLASTASDDDLAGAVRASHRDLRADRHRAGNECRPKKSAVRGARIGASSAGNCASRSWASNAVALVPGARACFLTGRCRRPSSPP